MVRFICLDHCCSVRGRFTSRRGRFSSLPCPALPFAGIRESESGDLLVQNGRVLNHLETDYRHITCLTENNLKLWQISLPEADWRSAQTQTLGVKGGWAETRPLSDGMFKLQLTVLFHQPDCRKFLSIFASTHSSTVAAFAFCYIFTILQINLKKVDFLYRLLKGFRRVVAQGFPK